MRVAHFPAPGAKVAASDFIITGGGCAANAALAIARLGGRAAFAGPLGGKADIVSERILADLAAEGVDCSGVARVDGGTASVSLILLDAEGEKTIATRRGTGFSQALPADADALVSDVDAVLVDNRFPEFVDRGLPGGAGAQNSDRHRSRSGDRAGRFPAQARHACDRLDGSAARHHRPRRTCRRAQASCRTCFGFRGRDRRAERRHLARGRRASAHAGLRGEGHRFAWRRRRLSRRLHIGRCGSARSRTPRCASPAPSPRSNARISAAPPARRGAPRSMNFSSGKFDAIASTDKARRRARRRRQNPPARPRGRSTGSSSAASRSWRGRARDGDVKLSASR